MKTKKLDILDYAPSNATIHPIMLQAWLDCILWGIGKEEIRGSFEKESGLKLKLSGIDKLIDEATGYQEHYVKQFTLWVNKNIWGEDKKEKTADDEL